MSNKTQQTSLPIREAISDLQIGTLLDVLASLQPYILSPAREIESSLPASLDGGTGSAAASTFIKACMRLETLIDDNNRWSLAAYDEQVRALTRMYEQQGLFLEAQTESAKELQRPSFQLRPILAIGGGGYVAIWGDPNYPEAALVGLGDTPDAALRDFDRAFHRKLEDQHQVIRDSNKPAPKTKSKPRNYKPTKKKKSAQ